VRSVYPAEPIRLESRMYRPSEIARLLGFPKPSVYGWIKDGEIKALKLGGRFFVPASEVERLISGDPPRKGSTE
jgi:excisionase family DNA binding protein